jgi:hypothetical protein
MGRAIHVVSEPVFSKGSFLEFFRLFLGGLFVDLAHNGGGAVLAPAVVLYLAV